MNTLKQSGSGMKSKRRNQSVEEDSVRDGHQGAIMASIDYHVQDDERELLNGPPVDRKKTSPQPNSAPTLPDVLSPNKMMSLSLNADPENNQLSFLLLDGDENFLVDSEQHFMRRLGCLASVKAKVVSIVGNTGEGKSYCLNRLFFRDFEDLDDNESEICNVFSTSPSQDSCTLGVWAAYDPNNGVIVLDTEGMLGQSGRSTTQLSSTISNGAVNENKRMRLLLKVLALSDIVIYKTRAERLHTDLFYFLGDASKAYNEHFSHELQKVAREAKAGLVLGPTVIIFHETLHTDVLEVSVSNGVSLSPETVVQNRLASLSQDASAFSKIRYFGAKRGSNPDERGIYRRLRSMLTDEITDTSVRSARSVNLIFTAFQSLNAKFSGDLSQSSHRSFPDEYFTCQSKCSACESRCTKQINHENDHATQSMCLYHKDFDNKQYFCLNCYNDGRRILVVPKASSAQDNGWLGLASYAWSGFVLECRKCGVIYRSRQNWIGNETPESMRVVHTEVAHIWPGTRTLQGTQNAARRLLDGLNSITDTVAAITSVPSKSVSGWMADQIAPAYWRPNSEIFNCNKCELRFQGQAKIHHCRSCGEGFCDECSNFRRQVPERGWGHQPVRVCHGCFFNKEAQNFEPPEQIQARMYGEKVVDTLGSLASAVFEYPISALKDSARPNYWIPDDECETCAVCSRPFEKLTRAPGTMNGSFDSSSKNDVKALSLHHCRHCGRGVCDDCSKTRKKVPSRGWDQLVRVCDKCHALPVL